MLNKHFYNSMQLYYLCVKMNIHRNSSRPSSASVRLAVVFWNIHYYIID